MLPSATARTRVLALAIALAVLAPGCLSRGDDRARRLGIDAPAGGDFAAPASILDVADPAEEEDEAPKDPSPDARLNLTAPWRKGDTWYYESNHSNYVRTRVLGGVTWAGERYMIVESQVGVLGYPPTESARATMTLDFTTVNVTTKEGRVVYSPPHPGARFYPRFGSYQFNESGFRTVAGSDFSWRHNVTVVVVEQEPLKLLGVPAGEFNASQFRVFTRTRLIGATAESITRNDHWYSPDVRNEIAYESGGGTANEELFRLVAARVAGTTYGNATLLRG